MCKVLIIDDDKDFAESVDFLFRKDGHDTEIAFDGETALAKLDDSIDVVLSDIRIGNTNGTRLASRIKELYDIPIIMITAYASTDTAIESLKNQVNDYLIKPCDPSEITEAVSKAARESAERKKRKRRAKELVDSLRQLRDE